MEESTKPTFYIDTAPKKGDWCFLEKKALKSLILLVEQQ